LKTIAFPSISTGAYRFPLDRAARIAVREAHAFLKTHPQLEKVILVCFDEHALQIYRSALPEEE
jgi:O-acetyl-ADP-ribose deacetylase (regulator of RNase III)